MIREHLEAMRGLRAMHNAGMIGGNPPEWVYNGIEDYILRNGNPGNGEPLTFEEMEVVKALSERRDFPIKQCFANSAAVAIARFGSGDDDLLYTEGVAVGIIPIQHAWLTFAGTGHIVDLTMRLQPEDVQTGRSFLTDRVLGGPIPEPREYFGVIIPTPYVIRAVHENEQYGPLIDDWTREWPLLRGVDPTHIEVE